MKKYLRILTLASYTMTCGIGAQATEPVSAKLELAASKNRPTATSAGSDNDSLSAPTGLRIVKATKDSMSLSWLAPKGQAKISGYVLYRDGQIVETKELIHGTKFTDSNLPDGEEFTYQVGAIDLEGNQSPLSTEVPGTTIAADTDHDGLPDEWENKYFSGANAAPNDDSDGDGQSNLQEFRAGTNPTDFYNGVRSVLEPLNGGKEGPNHEVAMIVRKPGGAPWPNAPVSFDTSPAKRRISVSPNGPYDHYQLKVRADANGRAQVFMEPLKTRSP
jgi:hypothetical protein